VRGAHASYVTSDNTTAAGIAVHHLRSLGHRKIATICGPANQLPALQRLDGFRTAMAELALPVPAAYVVYGDFFYASGYARMQDLLDVGKRPTGVFVAGDQMAIGAMRAIADAGLDVPGDISVVGFDDIESAAFLRPALTTIAQDYLSMGAAAVALLLKMIQDGRGDGPRRRRRPPPRLLPCRLVVRESTAPPASRRQAALRVHS
jgi:LacI family transcriptional regulator